MALDHVVQVFGARRNMAEFQEKTLTLSIYVVNKICYSLVIEQTTI